VKIGRKLTLQFTGIVSVILAVVLASIYSLTAISAKDEFYDKLKERAFAAANIFLEQDEVTKDRYEVFQKKYLESLPEEIVQVYDERNLNAFIERNEKLPTPKALLDKIRSERIVRYSEGTRQALGLYYEDNQGNFVILASAVDVAGHTKLESLRLILLFSFLLSLAVVYVMGRYFSRRALNPIRDVVQQVKVITASNLHLRLNEGKNKDELAELALTFNDTLRRLDLAFETQKTFVSNASHELRTPLTAIIGEIEVLLSKERETQEYVTTLSNVLQEAEELKELTNMLLSLAQASITERNELLEEIRLDELLTQARDKITEKTVGADVVIALDDLPQEPEGLSVLGNRHLLISAFANILENAVKFSEHRRVICRLQGRPSELTITVTDTGIGITESDLKNIFQPFFRGDNARRFVGHGVGLALAEKIIRLHGGAVVAASTLHIGTVVTVSLPVRNS
jgi:signal transduction histidine kinase